jgi:MFS transporter, DHA1 family, multidrug resistance protein
MSRKGLMLVLGALAAFGPLSIDMYLPGLPMIGVEYGQPTAAVQQTLTAFMIGSAFGQLFYGPLSDRFGRRPPLLVGTVLYTLAALGCALSSGLPALIALRLLQALGSSAGMVIARSVVRDISEPQEAARRLSTLMLIMGIAPVLAPILGGQLVTGFGWRSVFWVLTAFGVVTTLLAAVRLPETHDPHRRSQGGFTAVLRTYGLLLRDRRFIGFALSGGFVGAALFTYISASSFVFIELRGLTPQQFSLVFALNAAGLIGSSQLNRLLLRRVSSFTVIQRLLPLLVLCGTALVAVTLADVGGLPGFMLPLFLCLAGYGLISPNASALALSDHGTRAGAASALMGTLQMAVGAIAGALVSAFQQSSALPLALGVALSLLAALLSFTLLVGGRARPAAQPA